MKVELKKEVLRLLKEDVEFRYAVAGFIGLDEILKRLDRNEAQLVKIGEELVKLREDMLKEFGRHDEILQKHSIEIARLREDMLQGFKRHDEILEKHVVEIARLREDMLQGFKRHDLGLELLERRLAGIGARWGLMSEEAFREGLKGLLEKELKLKVERWQSYDDEGSVYGYPSRVEVDIALYDERIVLIEVTSHAKVSDIYVFKRKSLLYEKKTGKKPSRLLIVTPYADDKAIEASEELEIEVYTKV